jgi:ABC-type multidrug transport system ATPase subunit
MTATGLDEQDPPGYVDFGLDRPSLTAIATAPPLEIRGVVKRWRKAPAPTLNGVDLSVREGHRVWIGGRNGAGKTTLLRIVSGLIDPDKGEVTAYGLHPVRDRREFHRRVRFLSAGNTGLYSRLTVKQQIDCWARIALIPRDMRAAVVDEILEAFALGDLRGRRSDRLSMGQRQRLRIALAFIGRPDVVLLDEPHTSLDGEGGVALREAIDATARRGGAVVWCSPTGDHIDFEFEDAYVLENGVLRPA